MIDVAECKVWPKPHVDVCWLTNKCTPDEIKLGLETVRGLAAEKYKRLPDAIQSIYNSGVYVSADVEAAYKEVKWFEDNYHAMPVPEDTIRRWTIFGDPDECIKQMQPFADAGADVFNICIRARDMFPQVRAIARDVLPAFS